MEAKELRIGNLLEDTKRKTHFEFGSLEANPEHNKYIGVIWQIPHPSVTSLEFINPIPLTEEWLVKFGFIGMGVTQELQLDSHTWLYSARGKNVELVVENEHGNGTDRTYKSLPIKYVHSLQNLYFALTGKELTIK